MHILSESEINPTSRRQIGIYLPIKYPPIPTKKIPPSLQKAQTSPFPSITLKKYSKKFKEIKQEKTP